MIINIETFKILLNNLYDKIILLVANLKPAIIFIILRTIR